MNNKTSKLAIIPVMLCFFCMGFVDLVGIASNYVKEDLGLTDSVANIFPSLVFFWFLIFSVPTGMLMNKIGRKQTVLLSLLVTVVSLVLPLFGESFGVMLVAFSLLGIGNALMQTSLNPLVSTVMGGGNLASTLTFGQFVKAIASFSAPYLAMWGATQVIPELGLNWRVLFAIFLVVGALSTLWLWLTPIEEAPIEGKPSTFVECFKLLGTPIVLLSFLGIMCHVGIDVGTNTTAPKILMERLGMTLNEAAFATSLYFIFRTIGCLTGSFFLRVLRMRTFFIISVCMMALSMCGLYRPDQAGALRGHRPRGLRQQQRLLDVLRHRPRIHAREAERGQRPHDHGPLRRHRVPAAHGRHERCHGSGRRCARHGHRRHLPVHLYQTTQNCIRL